ncbi:MAG: hypothetical protein LPJ97_14485 [Marinobacter sp.]|nr:hypothetical protein [Marinobacter sp.]
MKKMIAVFMLITFSGMALAQEPLPPAWHSVEVMSVSGGQLYVQGRVYILATKVRMNGQEMTAQRAAEILSSGGNIMIVSRNGSVITELASDLR